MVRSRWWGLAAAAAVLVLVAWLMFDNPEIDGTSKGDGYACAAPWDTAVLGASNYPGGEPPPDADVIAQRCQAAGERRFALAAGVMLVSVLLNSSWLFSRRRRREFVDALRH